MTEEDVLKDALGGGNGYSSAYCLMYIRNTLIPKIPKGLLRSYTLTSSTEQVSDHYKSLLFEELKAEVDIDNMIFGEEIEEFRLREILRNISEMYTLRQNQAWTYKYNVRQPFQTRREILRGELCNLAVYLKIKNEESLSRWNILNECTKSIDPFKRDLDQLSEDPIFDMLTQRFKHMCKDTPYAYLLTDPEIRRLNAEAKMFYDNFYYAWLCVYIIESILDDKLEAALYGITYYYSLDPDCNTEYQQLPSEIFRSLLLYIAHLINKHIYSKNVYESGKLVSNLAYFTVSYINYDEELYEIISRRISASHSWIKDNIPSYYNIDIHRIYCDAIKDLETNSPHTNTDWNKRPENLEKLISYLNAFDAFSWVEGWENEGLATKYCNAKKVYEMSALNVWKDLSQNVNNQKVTEEDIKNIEFELGVFPANN